MAFITVKPVQIYLTNTWKECSLDRWVVLKDHSFKKKKKKKRRKLLGLEILLLSWRSSVVGRQALQVTVQDRAWEPAAQVRFDLPSSRGKLSGIREVPLRSLRP